MTGSCATCRFAVGRREGQSFYCHRYPPIPVYGAAEPRWPVLRWNEVCGEWAAPVPETLPVPADHQEKP